MAEPATKYMNLTEFLAWEEQQAERWEFVNGEAKMMTGGTMAHSLIASNIIASLRPALRGSPCRPNGSDLRLPIPQLGNSRYPDITVDCGEFDPNARDAARPTVIFEILSKSTGFFDVEHKVDEYATLPSVEQYICVAQSELRLMVWNRSGDKLVRTLPNITDPKAELSLPSLNVTLTMEEIYEGLDLIPSTAPHP